MDVELLDISVDIDEELLAHLRGSATVFDRPPRCDALFDTAFNGVFRIDVCGGDEAMLAVEHVGEGAFDWRMAEFRRRTPGGSSSPTQPVDPVALPARNAVAYRSALIDVDGARVEKLLAAVDALDWSEPTPEPGQSRDGVILRGGLRTMDGMRRWTTWSPEPKLEPAKAAFFHLMWRFALDLGPELLDGDLARVRPYLAVS